MKFYHSFSVFKASACLASIGLFTHVGTTSTVVLDEIAVQNLGIQTVVAEEHPFEETLFALGHIEVIPGRAAVVSSRIPGRLVGLDIAEGDFLRKDQEVARVESRQPGNNPPVIALSAPIKGLVMRSGLRLGDPVQPDVAIAEVADLSEVYAVACVPEYNISRMKPGMRARIKVLALGDHEFQGELLRFGTAADRESGTLELVFKLENAELLMRPGMRAEFDIVVKEQNEVLAVPKDSIQGPPSARHVYVKDFDIPHAFIRTPVQVGQSNDRYVEILRGIFPGDEVVTRGGYALGYVGSGASLSLKEALDAAHGHAHNEDGSEMTPEQLAAHKQSDSGHSHGESDGGVSLRELFFMISTLILAAALAGSTLGNRNRKAGSKNQEGTC